MTVPGGCPDSVVEEIMREDRDVLRALGEVMMRRKRALRELAK